MLSQLRAAIVILFALTVLTGIAYPLLVTGIAQAAFGSQANGNLMVEDGRVVGSELIGQPFTAPGYFWSRPSATEPFPYNATASSGSNLGPTNPVLAEAVQARVKALQDADPANAEPIPVDLVTTSASGLDPHISLAAALYQIPRVARSRGLSEEEVRLLVLQFAEGHQFGILGESRVNVLRLNLALDGAKQ